VLTLSQLVHPVKPSVFKREYWEQKPLVVERKDSSYYAELLTLADVDHMLATGGVQSAHIQAVRNGSARPLSKNSSGLIASLSPEAWYEEYRSGSTIVLQFLHERWAPLQMLCESLADDFSAAFQGNLYLTPPNSQGLATHYDTHDVFVVQVAGDKHWHIYNQMIELPLNGQTYKAQSGEHGDLLHAVVLRAGSAMYIPRGFPHSATSSDSASVHITIGALTVTWASVILSAVEQAIESDSRFRRSLPAGFADRDAPRRAAEGRLGELFATLVEGVNASAVVADAAQRVLTHLPANLEGHLLDLERESSLDLDTKLSTRPTAAGRLVQDGETVSLLFHGKRITMPEIVGPVLEFIVRAHTFTGADLPQVVDDAGKLVLIRRLLREGYLTMQTDRKRG
jgi:ribosomal protein L16 Arg81 hydroxylase